MRSLLFTPADNPAKFDDAMASGADAVVLDLEDMIARHRKEAARAMAAAFLKNAIAAATRPRLLVRVNGLASGLIDTDLDAVTAARPDAIVLPKAEGGASVIHLDAKLTAREAIFGLPDGGIGIYACAIETAKAVFGAGSYAQASPRLHGMTWDAENLSIDLGARANRDADGAFLSPYRLARSLCLAASAAARVSPIDTAFADFRDPKGLRREAKDAARDGFTGKVAIHPTQVPIINEIFTPPAGEMTRNKRFG